MSESKVNKRTDMRDSPYRRIAVLFGVILIGVLVLFGVNVLARGFGGNEQRLAQAFAKSLEQPYINASFDLSRQAQTNSFSVKGELHSVELQDISANLTVSAAAQSQSLKLPVEVYAALGDDSKIYVKGSELETLADLLGSATPEINADIASISKKLDNKWLMIPQSDTSASSCVSSLAEKLQSDEAAARKIGKLYLQNRFIVVDGVEEKNANVQEYTVRYQHNELRGFVDDLKKQDFYTSIDACTDDLQVPGSEAQSETTDPESVTKVLVEDGKVTSLNASTSYEGRVDTFSVSVNYKKGEKLTPPTQDVVKIDSIRAEITSVARFIMQQQMAASNQSTQ